MRDLRAIVLSTLLVVTPSLLAQPAGFITENVGSGWVGATGLTFDANGRMFVFEKRGRVWIVDNGVKLPTPLIDIGDEVGDWRDYGLLGFALHPNFLSNGHIYLYYVVDHHHLMNAGTPSYDPAANEYFMATTGRITRYTANATDNFESVDPTSRLVLLGDQPDNGIPILHQSHGTGSLLFGTDGTLIAFTGDGASYEAIDPGGSVGGSYASQALSEGIITPAENVGAFRSQMLDSLNGKILRLDPQTGLGVPSNPYYDSLDPGSARSRTWALGLRNPCRAAIRPGSGSHIAADGDPGVFLIGDVGWNSYEDLHVCDGPGQNFGWPLYEGHTSHVGYTSLNTANLGAPNPLWGTFVPGIGTCQQQYFRFKDLIDQETLDPAATIVNPCDPSQPITSVPTWFHTRPALDWGHGGGPARVPTFNGFDASTVALHSVQSPIPGPSFGGNCSIGGAWYSGTSYPPQWQNTYFHGDFSTDWIKAFHFDDDQNLISVENFIAPANGYIAMGADPVSGDLYYILYGSTVRRLRYAPGGNQAPTAVLQSDVTFGGTPLTVQFTGSLSSDPEGLPLAYLWDFGDGTTSTSPDPLHTFTAPAGVPTPFAVTLTITDSGSATDVATTIISVNNTPPVVTITSPSVTTYPVGGPDFPVDLEAALSDAEHAVGSLTCGWQVTLHHNDHTHPEPIDPNCTSTAIITPVGCDGQSYHYEITLTVTDPAGLSSSDTVSLFPDCPNNPPVAVGDSASVDPGGMVSIDLLANDSDLDGTLDPASVMIVVPPTAGSVTVNPATGVALYTHGGGPEPTDSFAYTVADDQGGVSNAANVSISTLTGLWGDYFGNMGLSGIPVLSRLDSEVSFDWGTGSPGVGVPIDQFSVRWSGQVQPEFSELTTIHAITDDGVRVWVDGVLVIDQWVDQPPTESTGTVALTAGVWADITMEYYENGVGAVAELRWSSASQPNEVIPTERLRPFPGNQPPVAVDDAYTVARGTSVDCPVLANDSDADGVLVPATVTVVSFPANGTAVVDPVTGTITYVHDGSAGTTDSFTYLVEDDAGTPSNPATVTLSIFDPPTLTILSPQEGETVLQDFTLTYQISGEVGLVDHWHYSWDGGPHIMVTDLSGTWTITGAPIGAHELRVWLVDSQHAGLPYPGSEVFLNLTVCDQVWIRGDTNVDLVVDIADAIALLDFLFQGGPAPVPVAAGDVNSDTAQDLSDVVYLLMYFFSGGTAPAAPFPDPSCTD